MSDNQFDIKHFLPKHIQKYLEATSHQSSNNSKSKFSVLELDRNESAWGTIGTDADYSKFPDASASMLKKELSEYYKIDQEKILFGNGTDELIDLLIRAFAEPLKDSVLSSTPCDDQLRHSAAINGIELNEIQLDSFFQLSFFETKAEFRDNKILFLSNPNPISGVTLRGIDVIDIVEAFDGIVVVDESLIGYQPEKSLLEHLDNYPNLIILQSFSYEWGMAGLLLGTMFASKDIINVLNKLKSPYNVNAVAQETAIKALRVSELKQRVVQETIAEREKLRAELLKMDIVEEIYKSEANFLLVRFKRADRVFHFLDEEHVKVFKASDLDQCENCLRITVGNDEQNRKLLKNLKDISTNLSTLKIIISKVAKTLQKASMFLGFFKKIVG